MPPRPDPDEFDAEPALRTWRVYLKPRARGGSPEIATVSANRCEAVGNLGVVLSVGGHVRAHYPFGSYSLVVQLDPETGEELHLIETDETAQEDAALSSGQAPGETSGALKPVAALVSLMPADGSWIDRGELFKRFRELTGANQKKFDGAMWSASRRVIEYNAAIYKARLRPKA